MRSASRVDVRWMFGPFQVAASISTRVVVSRTSERSPPMIPAIDVGPSSSQMMHHVGVERALDVVERGHRLAVAARAAPRAGRRPTRSKSNACIGWPVSSIT